MRIALMALLVAVSTPAFATEGDNKATSVDGTAAPSTTQTAKSDDSEEPKICKRIESSESRLGAKRVCLTATQWKKRAEEDSAL